MQSIRRRLTVHLLVVLAALTLLGNLVLYYRVRTALKHQYDDGLLSRAGALSHLVAWAEDGKMILEIPEKTLDEFNRPSAPDYLAVWRPDGTVFLRSAGLRGKGLWQSVPGPEPAFWYVTLPDGRSGRATQLRFHPHLEADEPRPPGLKPAVAPPPGEATLILASDMEHMQGFLHELVAAQVAGSILLATICGVVVVLAIRRGLVPLQRLTREAASFPVASLDRRFSEQELPAELKPIVGRLNDLLSRIEEAFRRERRFTSNVAHELRTPIAELRTLAEVALACPGTAGAEMRDYEETLAIARQMQSLVESLLALARAETAPTSVSSQCEDLDSIVQSALKPYRGAAAESGLRIDLQVEGGEVLSDRSLLEPLLRNVISNAVQYAPRDSVIGIRARVVDRRPDIAIRNAAPHLSPEDVAHFAEPFWRKDDARSDGQHAGLGFPLALAYGRLLGLSLTATLAEQELTVQIGPAVGVGTGQGAGGELVAAGVS